jgi:hypothetical protein
MLLTKTDEFINKSGYWNDMGFWSWLFGKKKEGVDEGPRTEVVEIVPKDDTSKDEFVGGKPKYQPIPRTSEHKEYVKSIVKKAESEDSKPVPHKQDVDEKAVKDYVDKIQGRK